MSLTTPVSTAAPAAPAYAVAGGLIGAIGAGAYISSFFVLSDLGGRESVAVPLCITANILMSLVPATMALPLPSLGDYLRVPRWVLFTTALAFLSLSGIALALGTLAADVTNVVTDEQWDSPGALAFAGLLPKMLLGMVGFGALAV